MHTHIYIDLADDKRFKNTVKDLIKDAIDDEVSLDTGMLVAENRRYSSDISKSKKNTLEISLLEKDGFEDKAIINFSISVDLTADRIEIATLTIKAVLEPIFTFMKNNE